jgi:hypothetical protein
MHGDTQVVSFLSFFQDRNLVPSFTVAVYHRQLIKKHAILQLMDKCWHSQVILVCSCEVNRTNFIR